MRHLQTFKYVKAIVKAGSIRGAAENLAISPSALNRNIQALELDLGITIFDRLSRGVALSVEGELFYRFALEQITGYERMTALLEGVKGLRTGAVSIGLSQDINLEFLCQLVQDFKNEFPEIELTLKPVKQSELERDLVAGEIDFALFYQPQLSRHIKINYSKQVDISLITPNGAQLGKDGNVRLYELEGLNLITPLADTELMVKLESACERQNMSLTPYLSCGEQTPYLQRAHVALIGLTIIPLPALSYGVPMGYKRLTLNEIDLGTGYLNIVVERKRHMTFAASKVHERLTDWLDQ